MIKNKVKSVQDKNYTKYNRSKPKNIKNIHKPKVYFDVSKHTRIFDQDIPEIKPEAAEMPELKTICDVDDTFYKVIEGRPLRQFIDVKVYMRNLRDITLCRANSAYLKDQIIQIDTSLADELKEYNRVYKLYDETKSNFFHFIQESYDTANEMQHRADAKAEELAKKIKELNSFSFMHVKLNNQIGSLAAVFGSLFRYGTFLNEVSPIWWINHCKTSKDFLKVFQEAESNPMHSFQIYRNYFIHESVTPRICFKKPKTLIGIFDTISRQCLNYIQIKNYFASIVRPVLKSRDQLEINIVNEINEVTDLVVFYEKQVKWMEEKEAEYKDKFNKLLFKEFYDLYASYNSTKLFTCVQFAHFCLFQGPEDPRDDITALVVDIENLFVNLSSKLDFLDQGVVKAVRHEIFSTDIKIIKRAKRAQRILKECDILKKSLASSFEPPRYYVRKCVLQNTFLHNCTK